MKFWDIFEIQQKFKHVYDVIVDDVTKLKLLITLEKNINEILTNRTRII